ncbi:MAG: TonB-dependent receptor, partial [Bacteroidota bacterium]
GPYTQITQENMPGVRGFSSMYGLTHTPGTWVAGMQLNKGAGSVVNGFESIAGQINVELRKPETAERLYLNLYANEGRRVEANANVAHRFNDKWSTALLLHAKQNGLQLSHTEAAFMDRNGDNFMDMPMEQDFIALNRWKYIGSGRLRMQAGVKAIYSDHIGGELSDHNMEFPHNHFWAMQLNTRRLEGFSKIGLVFPERPWRSVGLQLSAVNHEQDSYFGMRRYLNQQRSTYANLVYQGILGNTNHTFRTGASFQADWYEEQLNVERFDRNEMVPGAYFEYTYQHLNKFGLVAGIRADHHNLFGAFVTPRLHLRYAPREKTVFRLSGGRGQRTANILAENNGLFASSRNIVIQGEEAGLPYGLRPEVAWNFGFNFTQYFTLDYREGSFNLDLYRTDFVNQIVMDLENPREVRFYNLEGQSYSNSFQAQVEYELVKRVDVRLAYRWFDVHTTYSGELLAKPLVSPHRAFLNIAYETRSNWSFDYTVNWQGSKRLPNTKANPEPFQRADRSPAFVIMNAQVSKKWGERFELYAGGENLLNFKQADPIVAAADPFGPYFDASMVWGPIFGRNVYLGLRYRVE